jgi:FkbH-like protein
MIKRHANTREIARSLSELPYRARLDLASDLIARLEPRAFDPAGAEALFEVLQPPSHHEAAEAAGSFAALPSSATTWYLRGRWEALRGTPSTAAAAWNEFFSLSPCRDSVVLLHAARAVASSGDWAGAAARLREALAQRPDYTFYARAQAFIRQACDCSAGLRRVRVAVLGSATTSLLLPVFRALAFRDGLLAECYEGLFGAYRQEILDPASGLYAFAPDVTFIVPTWHDLALPSLGSEDEDAVIESIAVEHARLWEIVASQSRSHVVQHAFDLPPVESGGGLSGQGRGGRRRIIRRLNLRLAEIAPPFVSILDTEHVMAEVGTPVWHDAALWHRARQHPSSRALPALAEEQMAHLRAIAGLTRKVVVCDLDNTLWGGVIGEDGIGGIRVGAGSPEGPAHVELQRYLKELRSRGVLLAVASKNNPDDARRPFLEHAGMLLRLDDFAAFEANWDDKVTNLRRVAVRLSLGTDSFVFLDDNPFERAWIQSQLPEVAVVQLGPSPASYVRDLDRGRYFDVLTVSNEDRDRAEMYRRESAREVLRAEAGSIEGFLASLRMQASVSAVSEANLARVTQLVNKTNQFNVTTRRYTEAQVRAIAASPGAWTGVFELADRFGNHGIVGLMFCVPAEPDGWMIDTWLMSCRVLGRQLEQFMLDRALDAASLAGARRLVGVYRPTAKNGLVADMFIRLGFTPCGETDDGSCYDLIVATARTPYSAFITQAAATEPAGDPAVAPAG